MFSKKKKSTNTIRRIDQQFTTKITNVSLLLIIYQ